MRILFILGLMVGTGLFCGPTYGQSFAKPIGWQEYSLLKRPPKEPRFKEKKGKCYEVAKEFSMDHLKTLECRAETGETLAQYLLGQYYERPNNPKRDLKKAVYYYELAAGAKNLEDCKDKEDEISETFVGIPFCLVNYGYEAAQFKLGLLYAEGTVVNRDLTKSRFWFTAAKKRGLEQADAGLRSLDDLEHRIAARQSQEDAQ